MVPDRKNNTHLFNTKLFFSQSDEDEGPDLLSNAETTASSADAPQPSDMSADPPCAQSNPETGPNPKIPESQASSVSGVPNTSSPDAGPAQPPVSDPICAFSRAHLFIFDSESQQDDSQSMVGESSAAPNHPQPSVDKDAAFSLTQTQLEEDKQRIRELMNQTNQVSVAGLQFSALDFCKLPCFSLNLFVFLGPGQCDQSFAKDKR